MVIEDDSVVKILLGICCPFMKLLRLYLLLATDNHLGYLEKDPIRGRDSFLVFEEIMRKAQELEVRHDLFGASAYV